jgi:hypothetical protein
MVMCAAVTVWCVTVCGETVICAAVTIVACYSVGERR